jgi:hypothetical protein
MISIFPELKNDLLWVWLLSKLPANALTSTHIYKFQSLLKKGDLTIVIEDYSVFEIWHNMVRKSTYHHLLGAP